MPSFLPSVGSGGGAAAAPTAPAENPRHEEHQTVSCPQGKEAERPELLGAGRSLRLTPPSGLGASPAQEQGGGGGGRRLSSVSGINRCGDERRCSGCLASYPASWEEAVKTDMTLCCVRVHLFPLKTPDVPPGAPRPGHALRGLLDIWGDKVRGSPRAGFGTERPLLPELHPWSHFPPRAGGKRRQEQDRPRGQEGSGRGLAETWEPNQPRRALRRAALRCPVSG